MATAPNKGEQNPAYDQPSLSIMKEYLLAFISLFVAMDTIGVLPIFLGLTEEMTKTERTKVIRHSIVTAFSVGMGFLFLGKFIFSLLGVTVSDFKVGGGLILLIIAIYDLLSHEKKSYKSTEFIGVVPLGVPLLVGPAVMSTLLICHDAYGFTPTLFAFVGNLFFTLLMFGEANRLIKVLGEGGIKGIAKVMNLFLAAIGIMMIRRGILEMIALYKVDLI